MQRDLFLDNVLAFWAFVVGMFLCVIYDLFRVGRMVKTPNAFFLFVSDVVFSLVATGSFLLLFFNLSYGRVRVYALAFALLGFLLWRFTVSRITVGITVKIIKFTEDFLKSQKRRVVFQIVKISRFIYTFGYLKTAVKSTKLKFKEVKDATVQNGTNQSRC